MRYLITLLSLFFLECHNGATVIPFINKQDEGKPTRLKELFKQGKHRAVVTTNKPLTSAELKTMKQFLNFIRTNKIASNYFDSMISNFNPRKIAPIPGMSTAELKRIAHIFTRRDTAFLNEAIQIYDDGLTITFKATSNCTILDSIKINLADSSLIINDDHLEYYEPDHSFTKNKYLQENETFEYTLPFSQSSNGLLELLPIGKRYNVFFARLKNTRQTYFFLEKSNASYNETLSDPFWSIILE